jgi:hypothetical protein
MNIILATVVATPGGIAIELLGRRIPVGLGNQAALEGLKHINVGVRPQAVRLASPGFGSVQGRVFLKEPLGLEDEVLVETDNGIRVKVVTGAGSEFPEGAVVYLFHPDSGATLLSGIT